MSYTRGNTDRLTEKYQLIVELESLREKHFLSINRQLKPTLDDTLIHHRHQVVLEAQDAMVDIQLGQFLLLDVHLVIVLSLLQTHDHIRPSCVTEIGRGNVESFFVEVSHAIEP